MPHPAGARVRQVVDESSNTPLRGRAGLSRGKNLYDKSRVAREKEATKSFNARRSRYVNMREARRTFVRARGEVSNRRRI